ncbi:EAL domain-containing protein [Methylomonas sp. EFPC3]|uniref:EAL domain-containing protein n=1 Tax=Methylomonas sp. EFPC3 TaxID=3021710 RepID=UPI002415B99B|nr:EAL domain-containing protein [Methylomonas sp. EFPC3]WFP51689.1 EAL domain-containing protein [Methylomonas sp. EFPC3]
MKRTFALRLSKSLPALVIAYCGLQLWYQHDGLSSASETGELQQIRHVAADAAQDIEALFRRGQPELIAGRMPALVADVNRDSAALFDDNGMVLQATRSEWLGKSAAELLPELGAAEFARLRAERQASIRFLPDRQQATVYQAVTMVSGADRLGPDPVGLLVLQYGLSRDRATNGTAFGHAIAPALVLAVSLPVMIVLAVSLGLVRPLRHLLDVLRRFAGGDYRARAQLTGGGEMALLGEAFNRMAAELGTTIAELAESKDHLTAMLSAIGDAVIATDAQGRIRFMNCSAHQLTGWQAADVAGQSLERVFRSLDPDSPPVLEALAAGSRTALADWLVMLAKDGTEYPVAGCAAPIFSPDGARIGWLLRFRDAGALHAAQDSLEQEQSLLRSLIDAVPDQMFLKDRDGVYRGCNKAFESYAGIGAAELVGKSDFDIFDGETAACFREHDMRVLQTGRSVRFERRLPLPAGGQVCLETVETPVFGPNGEPTALVGISRDVTERIEAEDRLELSARVFQEAHEAIMITDVGGTIVDVNPSFCKITGYSRDQAIGQNPRMLNSGRHPPEFFADMWQAVREQGYWRGEIWNRKRNGELHAGLLSISTLSASGGEVRHYIGLFSDITEKKLSEEQIWRQANFDSLTALPNRRMFLDRLAREIKKAHRHGSVVALLFLDLDRFKEINDILGHIQGDSLLQIAAERLVGCVRDTDTVSRLGGDEFTIILPDLENGESAERVAQNILRTMAEPFPLNGKLNYLTVSIGITLYPHDSLDQEQLIKNADQAMYAAKERGRNGYSFFTASMQQTAQFRLGMVTDLRSALANREFEVYYQPIVELPGEAVTKAEALLRWRHPHRGMVSPAQFIPLAEESGLIHEIGDWVFRQAALQAKCLRERYRTDFQISVNKSPVQFRQRSGAEFAWLDYLKSLELDGTAVVVEITEGLLLDAQTVTKARLLDFRDAGVQVAIDDFGTGYSSLSYIKKFDIDYIKIDRTFINNLSPGSQDEALCEAIIVMAHKLGLKVVAEGVATLPQRDWLIAAGCDYAQGYLFAEPLAGPKLLELLVGGVQN